MTLPEELRQAAHYTALDHHRDLLERAAAALEADQKDAARYRFLKYDRFNWSIEHHRNGWSTTYGIKELDSVVDAALSTQGEKT